MTYSKQELLRSFWSAPVFSGAFASTINNPAQKQTKETKQTNGVFSCLSLLPRLPPVKILFPLSPLRFLCCLLWSGLKSKAAERTAALHVAGARSAHASKMAKLGECACLFWRFSIDLLTARAYGFYRHCDNVLSMFHDRCPFLSLFGFQHDTQSAVGRRLCIIVSKCGSRFHVRANPVVELACSLKSVTIQFRKNGRFAQ